MTASPGPPHYLTNVIGRVVEIVGPYKAVIEFYNQGSKQRALLKVEKLSGKMFSIDLDGNEEPQCISTFVSEGTTVRFMCHPFDSTKENRCGWFVADVQAINPLELTDSSEEHNNKICVCPTMFHKKGYVNKIDKRQGTIIYHDDFGNNHEVLFLASKLYVHGKRINTKQTLESYLELNDDIYFDAVPIDPTDKSSNCTWFATLAWTTIRPEINYYKYSKEEDNNLALMKMVIRNPKSQFIRGVGQIMQILNEEYGIAIGAVNKEQTHWQSIIFHRSVATLFNHNLGNADIQKIFKIGDRVCFIAASAPKGLNAQWIASHITIDIGDAFPRSATEAIF